MIGNRRFGVLVALTAAAFVEPVVAHTGSLRLGAEPEPVPLWLVLLTGGGVVGASFLLTSLVTDHDLIDELTDWQVRLPTPAHVGDLALWLVRGLGIGAVVLVVTTAFVGPDTPTLNFALLFVWAAWWAGYTMSVYLLGDTWQAINPWRTIAELLPSRSTRDLPEKLGNWPAVVGLLGLVWLEVVSPVGTDPRMLGVVILAYTAVTLAGAATFGPATWFGSVDPVARVFAWYGRVAPLRWGDEGISVELPGSTLVESGWTRGDVGFIVALLWVTTYDGLISTTAWAGAVRWLVGLGFPPLVVYTAILVVGFAAFLAAFHAAARLARRTGNSYVATETIRRRLAPSLLPIAAGYHFAHFLGYLVVVAPALAAVATSPFASPPDVHVLVLPGWWGSIQLAAILAGHVFAVWVAHTIAFELFTGRLQPIRSQYPFIAVMVLYTVTSMWIVTQPYAAPPYV